jgi:hypothetical protein
MFGSPLGLGFGRGEQIGCQLGTEPRPEGFLSFRAEIDPPLSAVMFGLVTLGSVDPNPAGRVNIDGPHRANLPGSHPREALEFDHRPDLAGDVGLNRVNERFGNRLDRLRLSNVGLAPTETRERFEAVMERRRNHFLRNSPLERTNNPPDPLIDLTPTEIRINHGLANGLESERPELPGQCMAIELAERPESQPDIYRLRCRLAVLEVIGVNMLEIRQDHLVHGEIGSGGGVEHHRPPSRGEPLGDDAIVFGPTLGAVMLPEIDVTTADRNDRQARWFMKSIRRNARS